MTTDASSKSASERVFILHMRPHTAVCVLILLYIKVRFDEDDEFKERARKEVVALQGGDSTSLAGNFFFLEGGGGVGKVS